MTEYVTPDGEVLEIGSRTPYQIACSELVAFKMRTMETVAADPRLRVANCTEAMIAYLSFVVVDKRTLKPTAVYASSNKLMARGRMKSKTTAKEARKLLVKCGYLRKAGETKSGCTKYFVENPNVERVKLHVRDAEEHFAELDAARKREDRRKKNVAAVKGVTNDDPPEIGRGVADWYDGGLNGDPKYHRGNLRGYISEEGETFLRGNDYATMKSDADDEEPFPIPETDEEAESMLADVIAGCEQGIQPAIRTMMLGWIKKGTMTRARARRMLVSAEEENAA
ncbi:hypothetical protein [Rhizobium sp. BK251]|uniref:hypothetical protein n=1 Tax=Rhizobium sp. BK251 TaxID=2512125 RepID=UPI001049BEB2|nr:hypothetical protein [Rhizobium sp. BK251]TCL70561.1 hypothetical protein EV286_107436 [Rhizobium sp. BK251]